MSTNNGSIFKLDESITEEYSSALLSCEDCGNKPAIFADKEKGLFRLECGLCDIVGEPAETVGKAMNNWDDTRKEEGSFWDLLYNR